MCTAYTLEEVRRHWRLYAEMKTLPDKRTKAIREALKAVAKSRPSKTLGNGARSAGPFMIHAFDAAAKLEDHYWKTGTTFFDDALDTAATKLNPTMVYSLGGEGCNVHYGTDPVTPFHLALAFSHSPHSVRPHDLVEVAKDQFKDWCTSFKASTSPTKPMNPVVRFIVGEATAVSRSLQLFVETGSSASFIPVAPWKSQLLVLSEGDLSSALRRDTEDIPPPLFNVIDTSNLVDHIGVLNVLTAAIPMLSAYPHASVMYTESLISKENNATKDFIDRLYSDVTLMNMLIGVCPVDYLSGFTTRSNTHELLAYEIALKRTATQFHQVTTWKPPPTIESDSSLWKQASRPPVFDPMELGTHLYDMYHRMFEQEDTRTWFQRNGAPKNFLGALTHTNRDHYSRESFVLFLKLVRDRIKLSLAQWGDVLDRFSGILHADQSMPMDLNNYQDLHCQLWRHGVFDTPAYVRNPPLKIGPFSEWDVLPIMVRIFLVVPRESLGIFRKYPSHSPLLQCDIKGKNIHNIFAGLHPMWGRVTRTGSRRRPSVHFTEDPVGLRGDAPLVVSFTIATTYLTTFEHPNMLSAGFALRSSVGSMRFFDDLDGHLTVFRAPLTDESRVYIVPEQRSVSAIRMAPTSSAIESRGAIGTSTPAVVRLDEDCEAVQSLTVKLTVEGEALQEIFRTSTPRVTQISPSALNVAIGSSSQDIVYPFPIMSESRKLRLARTSHYLEVVVPVFSPFQTEGMKLDPFCVVNRPQGISAWNIHRVNLKRLPILNISSASDLEQWLNPHVGSQLSQRERALHNSTERNANKKKKNKNKNSLAQQDPLAALKIRLHGIIMRSACLPSPSGSSPATGKRVFSLALQDPQTGKSNCDMLLFVDELRFDLPCHTVLSDAFILPLQHELMKTIEPDVVRLLCGKPPQNINTTVTVHPAEMQLWKRLLPALVERSRVSWTHAPNCEYKSAGRIPRSTDMEQDPLCSCGRGKDVEEMKKVELWRPFAPHVTRLALSPLFAVSYLETVIRDPEARKCFACRGRGKPKLMECKGCRKVRYCSVECQKQNWRAHKNRCKA